jgi:hypothetical protein
VILAEDGKGNIDIPGIVLETKTWHTVGGSIMMDIYVQWTTGEVYWCISDAVTLIKKNS